MPRLRKATTSILLAGLLGPAQVASGEELYELWYSVDATVRSSRADADVLAGGRLLMSGHRAAAGRLELSLAEVLEHPWKLYWVDPRGPFGEEVKVASVITLPEASWHALATARAENARVGRERFEGWKQRAERSRELDGTFAFIVIGPPQGRFAVSIGPEGTAPETSNGMTTLWIPGPFDQFIGRWGPNGQSVHGTPEGYWFWNDGESQPFSYEPHTYHALESALDLLALPLTGPNGGSPGWDDVAARASRTVRVLAPKSGRASVRFEDQLELEPVITRESMAAGSTRLTFNASTHGRDKRTIVSVERSTELHSQGARLADRIRVRVNRDVSKLEVEVGYRPAEPE